MIDVNALLAEAQALVDSVKAPKATMKLASVKAKKQPKIKAGINYRYDPATYKDLHKVPNWITVLDAKIHAKWLYKELKAKQAAGEWVYISLDTETFARDEAANKVPLNIVRRYVKKHPQDLPFALSIATTEFSYVIFDDDIAYYKDIIEDETIDKVLHNTKFDFHILANYGIRVRGRIWDTLVMIKLINENLPGYDLKSLALQINSEANKWEIMKDNWLQDNKCIDWRKVPRELMGDYAAGDPWWTIKLFEKYYPKLSEYELEELYRTESKLIYTLGKMERRGFMVDRSYLVKLGVELEAEVETMSNELYAKVGYIFNTNSSQQLYKMFMEQGVPKEAIEINPDTQNPILDKEAMERLEEDYPICTQLMAVKKMMTLKNTFIHGVIKLLDADSRVHGNWNRTEATTGRMSSTMPNLQNLPKKDKRIRKAYIAREGYTLFFFDLDQVEYRLFAHYARAQGLIEAIKKGWDVHQATGAIVYNVPYEKVTSAQRDKAKTLNFALIYGQGDEKTARSLKLELSEARLFKRTYFNAIPEAKPFLNTVMQTCKDKGYVRNFYKRRRHLSKDFCYKATNALIQGCAADYIKARMVEVDAYLEDFESGLVNIVHDELIVEIKNEEVDIVVPAIKKLIDDYTTFRVPITCGCEFSLNSWGDKDDYDLTKTFEENSKLFKEKRAA